MIWSGVSFFSCGFSDANAGETASTNACSYVTDFFKDPDVQVPKWYDPACRITNMKIAATWEKFRKTAIPFILNKDDQSQLIVNWLGHKDLPTPGF